MRARKQTPRFGNEQVAAARFEQDVIRACVPGPVIVIPVAVACDREHRDLPGPLVRTQTTAELDPVDAWHRDVSQNEVRYLRQRLLERLEPVMGLFGAEPIYCERLCVKMSSFCIILDDENER